VRAASFGVGPIGMLCVAVKPEGESEMLDPGAESRRPARERRLSPRVLSVPFAVICKVELTPRGTVSEGFIMELAGGRRGRARSAGASVASAPRAPRARLASTRRSHLTRSRCRLVAPASHASLVATASRTGGSASASEAWASSSSASQRNHSPLLRERERRQAVEPAELGVLAVEREPLVDPASLVPGRRERVVAGLGHPVEKRRAPAGVLGEPEQALSAPPRASGVNAS